MRHRLALFLIMLFYNITIFQLTDVPFDLDKNNLSKFEKIRDLYVAYSNVGAIIVPLKYYQHLGEFLILSSFVLFY